MKSAVVTILVVCSSPLSKNLQTSLLALGYAVEISFSLKLSELAKYTSQSVQVVLWEEGFLTDCSTVSSLFTVPVIFLTYAELKLPNSLRLPYTLRELCLTIEKTLFPFQNEIAVISEAHFQKILNNFPGCVFIFNRDSQVIYANQDCFGGGALLQNLSQESRLIVQQGLDIVFTYQETINFEFSEKCSYYHCRLVSFTKDLVLLFVQNISGQKQIEKELREQEEYYRLLVENQLDFSLRLNCQGQIEYANPTFCALVGKLESDILGKTCTYFTHQDDWEVAEQAMHGLFVPPYDFSLEKRMLTSTGWIWTAWSARSILNDRAEVVAIVTIGRDIHAQKMNEIALQENEEKLRFLAENTDQVFWILDLEGNLIYVNLAYERIWHKSCQSLYHNPLSWQESIHPDDYEEIKNLFSLPYHEDFSCVYRILIRQDTVRWMESRCFIVNINGKPGRILGTATDITDRVQAEEHRLALEKERYTGELRNQFFAMVSHELRTPLTSILTSTGILLLTKNLPIDKLTRNLERIQSSGKYMLELIENLLIFARAEAGALQQSPVPVFLEKFCKQLLEEVARTYDRQADAHFTYVSHVPLKFIDIDEILLRIVISNLLVNAFKFSLVGSPVHLCVDLGTDKVDLRVTDWGVGISLTEKVNIFKPFYHSKQSRGTGLGLAVVQKCVETMTGQIMLESALNQGSQFTVSLPYATEQWQLL